MVSESESHSKSKGIVAESGRRCVMECISIVRRQNSRTDVHCEILAHLEVVHVCKDVCVEHLKQVECCCCYNRIVAVASIHVSIIFRSFGIDRTVVVRLSCLVLYSLESLVVGVVVGQEID